MATLYVLSTETYSGKTAVCVSLGLRMRDDGYDVGYMKPVNMGAVLQAGQPHDEDVVFMKEVLGLPEPLETLAPVQLTAQRIQALLMGETAGSGFVDRLRQAYRTVLDGHDAVILEGASNLREGYIVELAPPDLARIASEAGSNAHGLAVIRYDDARSVDHFLAAQKRLGDTLLGVVVNNVPAMHMEFCETVLREFLENHGIGVFAVLPRQRILQATTVGELADGLGAEILVRADQRDELVENLMVGAMGVDQALRYFRRRANKAVITGGDRSDIQSAALETSTKCLILTGNLEPAGVILSRAEEAGVAVMLAPQDTLAAIEIAESYFGRSRFQQHAKIDAFRQLMDQRFDYARLYQALGLSG
jgi:BioD-like phosphotransacetylase family protein